MAHPGVGLVCADRFGTSLARLDDIVLHRTWLGSVDGGRIRCSIPCWIASVASVLHSELILSVLS